MTADVTWLDLWTPQEGEDRIGRTVRRDLAEEGSVDDPLEVGDRAHARREQLADDDGDECHRDAEHKPRERVDERVR